MSTNERTRQRGPGLAPRPPHYQARRRGPLDWGFTTPTGESFGFLSRFEALRAAANTERQDKNEAEHGSGPIAAVLRKHFAEEGAS